MLARFATILATCLALAPACVDSTDEPIEQEEGEDGKADDFDSADNPLVPSGDPTLYPVVLVHGFNASPDRNGFGPEVVKALCDDGHSVFVPRLPPFASIRTRSEVLALAVGSALAGGTDACGKTPAVAPAKVNLIAHSMGGLDSRQMITNGFGDRVATLTTISTPHGGSAMADMSLGLLGSFDEQALGKLAELLGRPLGTDPSQMPADLRAAFEALTESGSAAFNLANEADKRVRYESWAGLSNVAGIPNPKDRPACEDKMQLFKNPARSRHWMAAALKPIAFVVAYGFDAVPNDGLVQVQSAKYGTFRGCIPADHADEVGAFPIKKFDHIRFYRNRAFELAATGY